MAHASDLKRVRDFDSDNELSFSWRKSKLGLDHAWHATLYADTAAQILGVAQGNVYGLPMLATFKYKPQQ